MHTILHTSVDTNEQVADEQIVYFSKLNRQDNPFRCIFLLPGSAVYYVSVHLMHKAPAVRLQHTENLIKTDLIVLFILLFTDVTDRFVQSVVD